ncbi:50S ribosomal protein L29 [Blattabacterium cuenoti]|uniref:50S ribosomal protein L29 n=1 Tax=Blattabacterium cuenoti TaxID=1653831 RepID=UPI00163C7FDC|nr:50S ribosomal protein L29 [Blattabacterium cuenoti]
MKYSEFSLEEIIKNIKIKENNLQKMKMYHPIIEKKKNPIEIRMLRRDIARLKTEFNKRKIDNDKKK